MNIRYPIYEGVYRILTIYSSLNFKIRFLLAIFMFSMINYCWIRKE